MRSRPIPSLLAVLAVTSVAMATAAGCGSSGNNSQFTDGGGSTAGSSGGSSSGTTDGTTVGTSGPEFGGDADTQRPCEGLECQQVACEGGGTTSLSGTVFAPNGTLPLYNAIVYVPNAAVDAFPTTGVSCDKCGTTPSGKPVATALTDADGKFTLKNVPVGDNIPLVIQIGRWRRQITIPSVAKCVDTPLSAGNTRLPKNSAEGDIPKIAIATGGADSLECFFRKLGVDESEFSNGAGAGRIQLFNGVYRGATCQQYGSGKWNDKNWDQCTGSNASRITAAGWGGGTPSGYRITADIMDGVNKVKSTNATITPATELWGSSAAGATGFTCPVGADPQRCASSATTWAAASSRLKQYDMVVLSCEGSENNVTKDDNARAALRDYMEAGGRVFNSHFHYTWLKNPAATNPLNATATWVDNTNQGDLAARIDTSFAKGQAFGHWLVTAGAATVDGSGNTNSDMKELRKNVTAVPATSRRWIYDPSDSDAVKFYSFNMPLGAAADAQCGRAVYTDIHVSSGDASGGTFPDNCTTLNNGMTNQEKALLFLMMDLSSCIQDETKPPAPPPPVIR